MKVKTTELTRKALNWAVAKCEGGTEGYKQGAVFLWDGHPVITICGHDVDFDPATDWAVGGPIIQRELIETRFEVDCPKYSIPAQDMWVAVKPFSNNQGGPTPLIAAMRAYVFSVLGEEVEIPDELSKDES